MISVSDRTIVAWYDLSGVEEWFASMITIGPRMVLIVAFSVFALRTGLMARWVCWSGLAVAAFGIISFGDVFASLSVLGPVFLAALYGWWIWPLAVGGALGVRWLRTRPTHERKS